VCIAMVDDQTSNPEIASAELIAGVTYYIIVSSEIINLFIQTFDTNVDFDISVEQLVEKDAQIVGVTNIESGCGLNQASITATIKNSGLAPISGFDVQYVVNEASPVVESFTGTINPMETASFTFSQLADISTEGNYTITVSSLLSGDQNPNNDSYSIYFTHSPTINVFPSISDFEENNNYFFTEGSNSSWQHGSVPADADVTINQAYSGDNMWATNLSGNANSSETSYLISPCYDVSSINVPNLHFRLWSQLGTISDIAGTLRLQASIDGGANYGINIATWNASNSGWTKYEYELNQLQGETNVRFRFVYEGSFLANEGVAIDNFVVKDELLDDVGPGDLIMPISGCGLGSEETIKVEVYNYGANEQTNIPITYSSDGGLTWLSAPEIIAGPIPANDYIEYAFEAKADLSEVTSYQIIITTQLANDEDYENDSKTYTVVNSLEINTFPYAESFETEDHGWVGSSGSSWARGIPNDTLVINQAFDGEYVMATNPFGNANFNENSELVSPCFNFAGVDAIQLSMKVWYETGFIPATIDLHGSIDGGNTWFIIDQEWTGSTNGWVDKTYFVNQFAGEESCKIRVKYNGELLPAEGIAIDYVQLIPLVAKDVGVIEHVGPSNGCGLGSSEHFIVKIKNFGSMPQSGFTVQYSLDGGNVWNNQTVSGSLQALQTTNVHFNVVTDLSEIGTYDVVFRTNLIGDENPDNDVLEVTVVH
ncbi:MAG: hypothetical protein GX879_05470, partial [Bacteroidales bacterium]|nr:hypothetical protein [Bacteroidales bacterium]